MAAYKDILYNVSDQVALIQFNRPDRHNAQTDESDIEFLTALKQADEDPGVRAVVFTGVGASFCPGAALNYLDNLGEKNDLGSSIPRPHCRYAMNVRKPVVAAINGACAGVGLAYAMMADIRFASSNARFSTAFARRGLVAERAMSWLLLRTVGQGAARDLLMSARKFDATEAQAIGLVNRVSAPEALLEMALGWARDVAENCSPSAMAIIKQQLLTDATATFEDSLRETAQFGIERLSTPDFVEGVASFMEKRKPMFLPVSGENPAWNKAELGR